MDIAPHGELHVNKGLIRLLSSVEYNNLGIIKIKTLIILYYASQVKQLSLYF